MSEQEITEGNKLIAEFMGGAIKGNIVTFNGGWENNNQHWITGLQYHTSWDWLMPVYFKLRKIRLATSQRMMWGKYIGGILQAISEEDNPSPVFRKAVLAIKWYNQNK